jgi:hypothetical protein
MDITPAPRQERELNVGERVQIRQGRRPIPELLGEVGTVVEVFRVPPGCCLVRIDGDQNRRREWFFYPDEIATGET